MSRPKAKSDVTTGCLLLAAGAILGGIIYLASFLPRKPDGAEAGQGTRPAHDHPKAVGRFGKIKSLERVQDEDVSQEEYERLRD